MRVERMILHGVGPFETVDIEFPPGTDDTLADARVIVGPNGTGKTTLLVALAQLFSAGQDVGLRARMHGPESFAAFSIDGHWHALSPSHRGQFETEVVDDLRSVPFNMRSSSRGGLALYSAGSIPSVVARRLEEGSPSNYDVGFAAFAYSAVRAMPRVLPAPPREFTVDPFAGALDFSKPDSAQLFTDWLVLALTKAAVARDQGQQRAAFRQHRALTAIESLVKDITQRDIRFELEIEPFGVALDLGGTSVPLDLLPEGVKSVLAWTGDLLMRLDAIAWAEDRPPNEQPFVLLLDELDVHLHPKWQRLLLPSVQKLFPHAQVFLTTHSPFVIASARDGIIVPLESGERGTATVGEPVAATPGRSYDAVLRDLLGVRQMFDVEVEALLEEFDTARASFSGSPEAMAQLERKASEIASLSFEAGQLIEFQLRQLRAASLHAEGA